MGGIDKFAGQEHTRPVLTTREREIGACAPLPAKLFKDDVLGLARSLLGCLLVHENREGLVAGRIVEVEAYDQTEPASHSSRGMTPRTQVMFGPPGRAYVYFSYGVHWCMNVVAGPEGRGAAVLLRALEPLCGLELMAKRRGLRLDSSTVMRLARGPGCLTQAMAIDKEYNGVFLGDGPLRLVRPTLGARPRISATTRIGISKAQELPWRFCIKGSPFISGRRSR